VIGEEGILKELELAGYQYLGGPVSMSGKSYKFQFTMLLLVLFQFCILVCEIK